MIDHRPTAFRLIQEIDECFQLKVANQVLMMEEARETIDRASQSILSTDEFVVLKSIRKLQSIFPKVESIQAVDLALTVRFWQV